MIGISVESKKALKANYIGKSIDHLIVETSFFGPEYFGPDGLAKDQTLCYVGPDPYTNRKFFGQITIKNGILVKCS